MFKVSVHSLGLRGARPSALGEGPFPIGSLSYG